MRRTRVSTCRFRQDGTPTRIAAVAGFPGPRLGDERSGVAEPPSRSVADQPLLSRDNDAFFCVYALHSQVFK